MNNIIIINIDEVKGGFHQPLVINNNIIVVIIVIVSVVVINTRKCQRRI